MKKYTDGEVAKYLLETRQYGGPKHWRQIKRNAWRWALFSCLVVFLLGLGIFAQAWGFCSFVLGWSMGIVGCYSGQIKVLRQVWPFYVKVIDWAKVEKAAKGEQLL